MSGQQSENQRQRKKCKRVGTQATRVFVSTYDISSIKCVTRKFQVVQNNAKEIYKKVCCSGVVIERCFLLQLPIYYSFIFLSLVII